MPNKPTANKSISVKLDSGLGNALRQYARATKLTPAEVVYRALISYWTSQRTKDGANALDAADMYPGESFDVLVAEDAS